MNRTKALSKLRTIFLVLFALGAWGFHAHAQTAHISGVVNTYVAIDSMYQKIGTDVDSLIVSSVAGFSEGDTVMVYAAKGFAFNLEPLSDRELNIGSFYPSSSDPAGKYAFLIIDKIEPGRRLVILNADLDGFLSFDKNRDAAQLIRVPSYVNAEIGGAGLTAPDWNGSTGGVLALFVQRQLVFQGDINVNGKGLRGAAPSAVYAGACSSTDPVLYDSLYFYESQVYGGHKGEGIVYDTSSFTRGRSKNINGGGGGNGLYSGGGGGSNLSQGGYGGEESKACVSGVVTRGIGGVNLKSVTSTFYISGNNDNRGNRIFLGGGGGTGTQGAAVTSTPGGDGGGLVVIVADSLVGNGHSIRANGENVSAIASGAGGGGGGGGGMVLEVNGYSTSLNLTAYGGNGGNTNNASITGPGGGGGGGFYWLPVVNEFVIPGELNGDITSSGQGGISTVTGLKEGATNGGRASYVYGLKVPLLGFLFNSVGNEIKVCSDDVPPVLGGSTPKGGTGGYTYAWIDSTASHDWQSSAPLGTHTLKSFTFSTTLSETTYFKRIVTSGLLVDTSYMTTVTVQPAMTGNTIAAPDTVCSGNVPAAFLGTGTLTGGDGSYAYRWEKRTGASFEAADGANSGAGYTAPGLTQDTYFRRVVTSGACVDQSAELFVKVWNPIQDNTILSDPGLVCEGILPGLLQGDVPIWGDPSDYRFRWDSATNAAGPWTPVVNGDQRDYSPGPMTGTAFFRRVVLSGSDDACVSTSPSVEIGMVDAITGNTISSDQVVCENGPVADLTGPVPGGGDGSFNYEWQRSPDQGVWTTASGDPNTRNYVFPANPGTDLYYRRVVGSGGSGDVCQDQSAPVFIEVLDEIANNVITTSDFQLCQFENVGTLTANPVSGGDNAYTYKWQVATGSGTPGTWINASGTNNLQNYAGPQAVSALDLFYRRVVFSGPADVCKDTTDVLNVTIHTAISNNDIDPEDAACYGQTKILAGTATPQGEGGLSATYTWQQRNNGTGVWGAPTVGGNITAEEYEAGPFAAFGEYYFRRIAHVGACDDISEDSVHITVLQAPGATLSDTSFKACEQDVQFYVELGLDEGKAYELPWVVTLKTQEESGIGPYTLAGNGFITVPLVTDLDSVTLDYELESVTYGSAGIWDYTCVAPPGNMSGTRTVRIFRQPDPLITVDGSQRDSFKVCNTTVELSVNTDNGTGYWYSEPGGLVLFTPNAQSEDIFAAIPDSPGAYGKYVLTFRSEAGDCYGEDSIDIHYFEQPEAAFAGTDTTIFLNTSVILRADSATAGIGTWERTEGEGNIVEPNNPHTLVTDLGLGMENTFRWTVTNGEQEGTCVTSSDVAIIIRSEVHRYQGFSPGGGDGTNEYLIMQGLKYADSFKFTVFNSLGALVYEVTEQTVGELNVDLSQIPNGLAEDEMVIWDGTAKNSGNYVPAGTYYYVLQYEVRGFNDTRKDWVVITRE
ncbi:MAG: gliding motility-associated C-terminal domain-containing protein [Bacteroidales bacterium]